MWLLGKDELTHLLVQLEQAKLVTGRADNTRGQLALSTPPS